MRLRQKVIPVVPGECCRWRAWRRADGAARGSLDHCERPAARAQAEAGRACSLGFAARQWENTRKQIEACRWLVLHARDAAHQAAHWAGCTIVVNFVVTLCCVFLLLRVVSLLNSDNKSETTQTQTHASREWTHYRASGRERASK